MKNVFVIISETMPVNGTYPASSNEGFFATERLAWERLAEMAYQLDNTFIADDDTIFYTESFNPEKYEYIEYRIEEHTVQHGE